MQEQDNYLLLYAKPSGAVRFDLDDLQTGLREAGFIGDNCHGSTTEFFTGERFMDLMTFLGCSPNIALSPEDGSPYCFIRLLQATAEAALYSAKSTVPPHCPQCRQSQRNWRDCEQADYCTQCNLSERAAGFRWRKQGALSHWVVQVLNIYPHEAVPSAGLLQKMQHVSAAEWGYAYLQRN